MKNNQVTQNKATMANINKWVKNYKKNNMDNTTRKNDFSKIKDIQQPSQIFKSQQQQQDSKDQLHQTIQNGVLLYNIGRYFQTKQSDNKKAIECYKISLRIFQKNQQEQSIHVGDVLNNIGVIYLDQGNIKKALQCFKKSIKIRQKIGGKNNIDYADTLMNIGCIYNDLYNLQQAMKYFEQALKLKKQIKGQEDISCINQINNIGTIYSQYKDYDKAILFYQRALNISIKTYGENSIQNALFFINIGRNYFFKKNDKQKGLQYLQKSLNIFKSNNVKQHIEYAAALIQMGNAHMQLQKYKEAIQYYEQCKEMYQKILGKDNENFYYKWACDKINWIRKNKIN